MRFNILLSVTVLATFAAGLVIPADESTLASRDIELHEVVLEDLLEGAIFKREPSLKSAAKAHKATTNLPNRHSTFHIPGGAGKPAHTYTGKDVRKAVFESHREAYRLKHGNLSNTQKKKSPLKPFNNYPHAVPKVNGGAKPLDHMRVVKGDPRHPPGREFPLPNHHNPATPGPARVITQKTKKGNHTFRGVISHDQSRLPGTPGYNDHFKVKPRKH